MTTNEIAKFDFGARTLRVLTLDGEPWFLAADICHTLGLFMEKGVGRHIDRLDPTEKRRLTPSLAVGLGRGLAQSYVISESGFYKLVMRSEKPIAKPFQNWVTEEVLPSIRKTGSYAMPAPGASKVVAVRSPALPAPASPLQQALDMVEARIHALGVTGLKSLVGDHQKLTTADTNHSFGHPMRMTIRLGAGR